VPNSRESSRGVVRFGVFEADLATGELRRRGVKVALQEQPFQVLALLLENAGALVTRERLRQRIWPEAVFVDFEHGLNKAVSKLRRALGDSADSPRFVETLARRGYRFLASIEPAGGPPSHPRRQVAFRLLWEGRTVPLAPGASVIGRDPDAAVWVEAASVSRRHAQVMVRADQATVEDLRSKNGTFVNGRRIEAPTDLADGDQIRVGVAVLVVRAVSSASTRTQARGDGLA
jgi:DNA-binding winged helix-turn-helix (wHTH) protein